MRSVKAGESAPEEFVSPPGPEAPVESPVPDGAGEHLPNTELLDASGERGDTDPFEPAEFKAALPAGLHLVATPIGNLGDITPRAEHALRGADIVACEDTRRSGMLMKHLGFKTRLVSLHEHNEASRIAFLLDHVRAGGSVALISDAGIPTVSDPGQRLVAAAVAAGVFIDSLPGASAVLTALSASGLPTTPFWFGGFLPHKSGAREREVIEALAREATSVFFESPYRCVDTLEMLARHSPQRRVVVARELTKKFAEFQRGTAETVLAHYRARPPKGEITLLIGPATSPKWLTW
jgi:16S rRNA (cytidine1402-2'-O)-methyltransferase